MKEMKTRGEQWDNFVNTNLFCFALLSKDCNIIEFNKTAIQFLDNVKAVHGGQEPTDLIGKHVTDFYNDDLALQVQELLDTGRLPFELNISAGEGQMIVKAYFLSTNSSGEKFPCLM